MKDLTKFDNTIACYLSKHIDNFNQCFSASELRESILTLLHSDELKDNPATNDAINIIKTVPEYKLYSTIVTYITGQKVIK